MSSARTLAAPGRHFRSAESASIRIPVGRADLPGRMPIAPVPLPWYIPTRSGAHRTCRRSLASRRRRGASDHVRSAESRRVHPPHRRLAHCARVNPTNRDLSGGRRLRFAVGVRVGPTVGASRVAIRRFVRRAPGWPDWARRSFWRRSAGVPGADAMRRKSICHWWRREWPVDNPTGLP